VVAHTFNLSFLGDGDQKNGSLRPVHIKKTPSKHIKKPGMVGHVCNLRYMGGVGRRIMIQSGLGQKM
jgi:hypothetical protein